LFGNAALKGDRFHLKLNIIKKPIAKKYCEGKVKRTLKRELKVLEIVKREANKIGKVFLENTMGFLKQSLCIFFKKRSLYFWVEIKDS